MIDDSLSDPKGFTDYLRKLGKQTATIDSYCHDTKDFFAYLADHNLKLIDTDDQTVRYYQEHLKAKHELPNSIRRKFIGIRQYYRYLVKQQRILTSPMEHLPIPQRHDFLMKSPDLSTFEAYLSPAPPSGLKPLRDRVALCLLGIEGLKVSEIIDLEWHHYLPSSTAATLRIDGTKDRTIAISALTRDYLDQYRHAWTKLPNLNHKLLVGFKGRDASLVLPAVTRHGIKFMIYEVGMSLNIKKLNAEKLRHFAIERLISEGRTMEEIMTHLGLRTPGNILLHMKAHENHA